MAARIIGLNDEKVRARLVEVVKGDANKVLSVSFLRSTKTMIERYESKRCEAFGMKRPNLVDGPR